MTINILWLIPLMGVILILLIKLYNANDFINALIRSNDIYESKLDKYRNGMYR